MVQRIVSSGVFLTMLATAPILPPALPQWDTLPAAQPIVHAVVGNRVELLPLILPPTSKTSYERFFVYKRRIGRGANPSRDCKGADESEGVTSPACAPGIQAYRVGAKSPLWETPILCPRQPQLLHAAETTAIFATGYAIYAADVASGELLWRIGQEPAGISAAGSDPEDFPRQRLFAADDDRLVAIAENGQATCVAHSDGTLLWSRRLQHRPTGNLVLHGGTLAFPAMVDSRAVCCVYDVMTGVLRQIVAAPASVTLSRVLIALNDRVLLVAGPIIAAHDIATGARKWQYTSRTVIPGRAVIAGPSGIYVSHDGHRAVKLDPATGAVVWQSATNRLGRSDVVHLELRDGQLVVAAADEASLVDCADGQVIARRALGDAGSVRSWEPTSRLLVGVRESSAGVVSLLKMPRDLHGDRSPSTIKYQPNVGAIRSMVICDDGFAVGGAGGVVSFGVTSEHRAQAR